MALNKQAKTNNEPLEMVGKYKTGEFVVSQNKSDKKEVNWKDYPSAVFDESMVVGPQYYGINYPGRSMGTISTATTTTAMGATLAEATLNDAYRWRTREFRIGDEAPHAQQENRRR